MANRTNHRLRPLGAVSLAVFGTASLGSAPLVTPGLSAELKTVAASAALVDTESWIMGGSGLPIPPASYLQAVSERFINPSAFPEFNGGKPLFPDQPEFPVSVTNPLFTPEGLYPLTGVKSLELDPSLQQGVSILDSTIANQVTAGNNLVVLGYSQSATINSLTMKDLLALPTSEQPTAEQLAFVLLGDPSNPNGGLLSRFDLQSINPNMPELTLPSVGITFSGATPADTPWDTAVYTQEYDGFADFPRYPINLLADLNAFLGILFVHGTYPALTTDQLATAKELPTSPDYTGHTQYFMIPTENLPLLDPLRGNSFGNAIADLVQPDLRVLVNLGYGDIDHGWDQGYANLPTPMGLFPNVNPADVFTALGAGAQQGWTDFVNDLTHPSTTAADLLDPGAAFTLPTLTDVVNAFTSAASTGYATLLPTADIINTLITTLPAYNVSIFTNELAAGNLLNAIGLPIAADVGLGTMAGGFEFEVIAAALSSISADFSGLFS